MAKIEPLSDIGASYASITTINANMDKITAAFDNTLSRDGSTPNSMQASLDMNSNKIINVLEPVSAGDVATKNYVDTVLGAVTGLVTPIAHTWAKLTDGVLTLDSYAALSALSAPGENVTYRVRGHTAKGDGGAGDFYYVAGSTATVDNGCVLTSASGRFFRIYDGVTVTPEWYKSDGTVANDNTAFNTLVTLGKTVECKPGKTYKLSTGKTITADNFKLNGNRCTFEIQVGSGQFDNMVITNQFNGSGLNTCLFYGLSREGLEFRNFKVTQSATTERAYQVIGVRGGHESTIFMLEDVVLENLHSARSYITISSLGTAGYFIDGVEAYNCSISTNAFSGGTPDVAVIQIDADLLSVGDYSINGVVSNITGINCSFTGTALSTYTDQTDVLTIGGTGNTHGPDISNVYGKNVAEVVDCFGDHATIEGIHGDDCLFVLKFVHGASFNTFANIIGENMRANGAIITFAGSTTAGAGNTEGNVGSNIIGQNFNNSADNFGVLFQLNGYSGGAGGFPKNNTVTGINITAGPSGTAPSHVIKCNLTAGLNAGNFCKVEKGEWRTQSCQITDGLNTRVRGPATGFCEVRMSTNQAIPLVDTTVQFNTVTTDYESAFNTTTYKYRPAWPGPHHVLCSLRVSSDMLDQEFFVTKIFGDGNSKTFNQDKSGTSNESTMNSSCYINIDEVDIGTVSSDIYVTGKVSATVDCTVLATTNITYLQINRMT